MWDTNPSWRAKKKDGTDYIPASYTFLLSTWHDSYISWYDGFVKDLLNNYPDLDGIEAIEPFIDWNWDWTTDYNSIHNQKYFAKYPSGTLGDANWKIFRAEGLTNLIKIMIADAHAKGTKTYVVQTWTAKSDGNLMRSEDIRDGAGFDFNGIMNLLVKPDFVQAELIWQQWAAEYGSKTIFNADWTTKARDQFVTNVAGRTAAIVHVEISPFGTYTPTNTEFETSLKHARTNTQGADFYDHKQVQDKNAWVNVKNAYA